MSIKSVSIAARVVMDLHALNNEGSQSNRLMTRQVGIVTPVYDENAQMSYRRDTVNAVSGDMNKHIFADHYRHIALDEGLHLCEACKALDPARMMGNAQFEDFMKSEKRSADEVIDHLLTCALDDVCGIMITAGNNSVKRKSAVEFGWTVGLPEITEVQEFIHARHAINRLTRTKATRDSDDATKEQAAQEKGSNLGQMIFDRPASSGVYAFVSHVDVAAIGFNDAAQTYIDQSNRQKRMKAVLIALMQTLLHPKGALTSTQLPHVVDLEGFIAVSESAITAPLISPLSEGFIGQAVNRAELLNTLHQSAGINVMPFQGAEQLIQNITQIVGEATPGVYREL